MIGRIDRRYVYYNAVVERTPLTVNVMSLTNSEINESNGHVTIQTSCRKKKKDTQQIRGGQQYGVDYMETVTLNQVMSLHHSNAFTERIFYRSH